MCFLVFLCLREAHNNRTISYSRRALSGEEISIIQKNMFCDTCFVVFVDVDVVVMLLRIDTAWNPLMLMLFRCF